MILFFMNFTEVKNQTLDNIVEVQALSLIDTYYNV